MITEIISLSKRNTQTFPYRSMGQNERILKKNGRKTEPIKAEVIFYLENQEVNLQYTFKIKCLNPALLCIFICLMWTWGLIYFGQVHLTCIFTKWVATTYRTWRKISNIYVTSVRLIELYQLITKHLLCIVWKALVTMLRLAHVE